VSFRACYRPGGLLMGVDVGVRSLILLLEEPSGRKAELERVLEQAGYAVHSVTASPELLPLSGEARLVVLGLGPPGGPARALLPELASQEAEGLGPPVLVLVPEGDSEAMRTALRLGVEVVRQPVDVEELLARLERCLLVRERQQRLGARVATLEHLSITDGLTQVHNYRYFQDRLREEFRRAQRYDDPLSLILLDLDHFKAFNDEHGHQVGDGVLSDVAAALERSVRETDLVARYGGEEFAILLPRTSLAGALTVAERVWRELGALRSGPAGSLRVTASLGVSGFPHHAINSPEQLVRTADQALYRAKREGRDRICLHAWPLLATPAQ
jgi:two-component system cell cycle response regulator